MRRFSNLLPAIILVGLAVVLPARANAEVPEVRVVELFEELAQSLDSNDDCDQVEKALRSWASTHGDELKTLVDETRGGTRDMDPQLAAEVEQRMGPAMHHIFSTTMGCGEHNGTLEAMNHIDEVLNGSTADASAAEEADTSE